MLDYLQKFDNLSSEVRSKISNKEIVQEVIALEDKYGLDLVPLVIKIAVKQIDWQDVDNYLIENFELPAPRATELKKELAQNIFKDIADYLGIEGIKTDLTAEKSQKEEKRQKIQKVPRGPGQTEEEKISTDPPQNKKAKKLSAYDHDHEEEDLDLSRKDRFEGGWEDLVLDKEDEEEIKESVRKVDQETRDKQNRENQNLQQKIEAIVKKCGISFSSEASRERFEKIILTYLKGVRSRAKTLFTLTKDFDKGGLGLGEKVGDKILNICDQFKGEEEKKNKNMEVLGDDYFAPQKKEKKKGLNLENLPERDVEYDLSSLKKNLEKVKKNKIEKEKFSREDEEKYDLGEILKQRLGEDEEEGEKKEKEKPQEDQEGAEEKIKTKGGEKETEGEKEKVAVKEEKFEDKELSPGKESKKLRRQGEVQPERGKKSVHDIKKAPRLINPISELKYLDLNSFRRLGQDARERADKIKEKIANLEKKYFYRKVKGIQAWRQSPVNKLYLKIGRESIVYSQSVDDIIKKRKKEKKEYLSREEFDAIMDLNNQLRKF